jgi:hypothetical protein
MDYELVYANMCVDTCTEVTPCQEINDLRTNVTS